MAVAVGTFAMLVILPTIIIGLYGAIRYPDVSVPEFLGQVLLRDQPEFIAAAAILGLFAAAMSTSDSQLFALGNELRGLLGHKGSNSLIPIKIAIISFATAALLFSLFSSNQLVLLARISFAGTAMMGPLVMLGILSKKPMGLFMIIMSGLGLAAFVLSQVGVLPTTVGPIRMDLFLMIVLALCGFGNYILKK